MIATVDHIDARTFHGRKGRVDNAFTYTIDYVLMDAEADVSGPWLFSRNRRNLFSVQDCDHGGAPHEGRGADWVREVLTTQGIAQPDRIELLAQPRVLGHVFNPVSFWLCRDALGQLVNVVAEVTNTFGDRHSYICGADGTPIAPTDTLRSRKILHVSPFQDISGGYAFRFDIRDDKIGIWIDFTDGNGGLLATLTGSRRPLTNWAILRAAVRRPFGSRRVLGLIHWQALKLWWKGARYRSRPEPPEAEVS